MKITQKNVDKVARIIRSQVTDCLIEALDGEPLIKQVNVQFGPTKVFVAAYAEDDSLIASIESDLKVPTI